MLLHGPPLPIKGIDFIVGKNIAGGKVNPVPEVTETPKPDSKMD